MNPRSTRLALLFALLLSTPLAAQDNPPSSAPLLTVSGSGISSPFQLTEAEWAKLPRRTIRASAHDKEAAFEGVPLAEVLKRAGFSFEQKKHGEQVLLYLIVEARDGYRALFAMPELDSAYTDREVLVADRRDSKPLSPEEGPLRIVVPGEKRPARWVRQVSGLRIEQVAGQEKGSVSTERP